MAALEILVVTVIDSKKSAMKTPARKTIFKGYIFLRKINGDKKIPPAKLRISMIQSALASTVLMMNPEKLHNITAISIKKLPLLLEFSVIPPAKTIDNQSLLQSKYFIRKAARKQLFLPFL